jgi:hypothetical protein
LSPSKYSPPLFILLPVCLPVLGAFPECLSWNTAQLCQRIFFNLLDRLISSFFNRDFVVVKRKKSAGARYGDYRDCEMNSVSYFVRKSHYWRGGMCRSIGIMEQPFFPSSQITASLSLFIIFSLCHLAKR